MENEFVLSYEQMDCYKLAVAVADWAAQVDVPVYRKHLRDQLVRAADSVVLNIAEGSGQRGDARRNFYRIALGSAAEVNAAIGLLRAPGGREKQAETRRVCQMLARMSRA